MSQGKLLFSHEVKFQPIALVKNTKVTKNPPFDQIFKHLSY